MVLGRNHCTGAVSTGRKTPLDNGLKETLTVASVINALKKGELCGVWRRSRLHGTNVLDGDMEVIDNIAIVIQVLWGTVVVGGGVDKIASNQMRGLHRHIKGRVGGHDVTRLGVGDYGRDHVGGRRDAAHGYTVAGSGSYLLSIGEFLTLAEVNKIIFVSGVRWLELSHASGNAWVTYVPDLACPGLMPCVPVSCPVRPLAL